MHQMISDFPSSQSCTYCQKWAHLLVILQSIVPDLPVDNALFPHLQGDMTRCTGRIFLTVAMHFKLEDWEHLIDVLYETPTHLLEVVLSPPTWNVTHNACQLGLGGLFWGPDSVPHLWCMLLPPGFSSQLIMCDNLTGYRTMGEFYLVVSMVQVALMSTLMGPFVKFHNGYNLVPWLSTMVNSTTSYLPWYLGRYGVFHAKVNGTG